MNAKLLATTSNILVAAVLSAMLCSPLSGCSGCSVDRGSIVVEKTGEGGSAKKSTENIRSQQGDDNADANADTAQEAAADATDIQPSNESKTVTIAQGDPGKNSANKTSETENATSKPIQSKQKWIPEQDHWETDYSQVWVPNIVYTRHERCICTVCGAVFDSKSSFYAHSDTMWPKVKTTAATLTTPTPPRRTRATTNSRPRGSIGLSTSPGIGSRWLVLPPRYQMT